MLQASSMTAACRWSCFPATAPGVASADVRRPNRARLRGRNKLGTYFSDLFHGRFERFGNNRPGWSKVLWDVSAIAWLLNEEQAPPVVRRTPILNPNFTYSVDDARHFYKEAIDIHSSSVFIDMFAKLSRPS